VVEGVVEIGIIVAEVIDETTVIEVHFLMSFSLVFKH